MKRINVESRSSNGRPSWMPWGLGGVAWRYLLFIALLIGYLFLLKLLIDQKPGSKDTNDFDPETEYDGDDDLIRDIIDNPEYDPYEDDRYLDDPVIDLPDPEDNRIDPVPDDEIIDNPDNPYKKMIGTRLNVIINSDDREMINRFATEFKRFYPSPEYFINAYNAMTMTLQITLPMEARERVKRNLPQQITDIDFIIFDEEMFNAAAKSDYNDPAFKNKAQSWHFEPIQAYEAWDITKGNPSVVVAVVDSWIDITHPEFEGRVKAPYNVPGKDRNVLPPKGRYSFDDPNSAPIFHGTHVAALAVGALDNGQGAAGLAPECTLMPISLGNQMTSMKLAEGILYAIHQGADVVNVSIGTYFGPGINEVPVEEQLEYIRSEGKQQEAIWDYIFNLADERNCMIVWAAGNEDVIAGLDVTKRNPSTLRVSSVDSQLHKSDFSNYASPRARKNTYSDVSAPGSAIYSAGPGKAYGICDGTSMAAPIVTGAVALMKSINPNLKNEQIIEILKKTGKPIRSDEPIGNLIQVRDALQAVKGELANFDEIIKNPDSLIGVWETTEQQVVTNTDTGVPTGAMTHVFLIFSSPKGGRIEYREDTGCVYTGNFTCTINGNSIIINQPNPASSKTCDNHYVPTKLTCKRGENGLLECRNQSGSTFYLVRIK